MEIDKLKLMMETPIYSSLAEIFDRAKLSDDEKDAFLRNKSSCEYWLLRSKIWYHKSFSPNAAPNFIKCLARVLNYLESEMVSGKKKKKIREMFGKGSPVHNVSTDKNGVRSKQNSNILENTYFELLILSFFVVRNFRVNLIDSKGHGKRISEFIVSMDGIKLSVEAKVIDTEKILDKIFGDVFVDGIDHQRSETEQQKGFEAIKSQIETRYEDAMDKYQYLDQDEHYIVFVDIYSNNNRLGQPAIRYLNSLQSSWVGQDLKKFVGVVIPEEERTIFLHNVQCDEGVIRMVEEAGVEKFHEFIP